MLLESPRGPLEVRALFLQVLVVRIDGHKLWKAEGIDENASRVVFRSITEAAVEEETTEETLNILNNLSYSIFFFFFNPSV